MNPGKQEHKGGILLFSPIHFLQVAGYQSTHYSQFTLQLVT